MAGVAVTDENKKQLAHGIDHLSKMPDHAARYEAKLDRILSQQQKIFNHLGLEQDENTD